MTESRRFATGGHVPIIRQLELAVIAESPITLSFHDARAMISIMESTRDIAKEAHTLKIHANRLWYWWLSLGVAIGLLAPRLFFMLYKLTSL